MYSNQMECTPGEQKCVGPDLYECRYHYDPHTGEEWSGWVLIERDSPQCVVEPEPEPEPEPEVVPCEITITVPDSAAEDETVSVSALLKNVSSYGFMYKIEIHAVPDLYPAFRIGTIEKYINSGSSFTAYGSFTMPASNTTILIWVERWSVDHWAYDNSASKVVSLEIVVPEPEFRGFGVTEYVKR